MSDSAKPAKTATYFGTTVPPLTEFIKNLLGKYTEGQILKEIVQNADDAGTGTVRFVVDPQHYPVKGLVKESLTPVQGPALLAWNDAKFKEEDWSNIGKLYQSKKMEEKMKVGRFGIGFQSVHHITDFGTTVPPLTEFIKNLLGKYTEGQILKEIVQNADDAGAGTFRFVVDPQHYPVKGLVKDSLTPVQGPALLAWNDAKFKDEDWSNIGKLYQSKKMEGRPNE